MKREWLMWALFGVLVTGMLVASFLYDLRTIGANSEVRLDGGVTRDGGI